MLMFSPPSHPPHLRHAVLGQARAGQGDPHKGAVCVWAHGDGTWGIEHPEARIKTAGAHALQARHHTERKGSNDGLRAIKDHLGTFLGTFFLLALLILSHTILPPPSSTNHTVAIAVSRAMQAECAVDMKHCAWHLRTRSIGR